MTSEESNILKIKVNLAIINSTACIKDIGLVSPTIQWVGGKKRLLSKIISHLPDQYGNYHELFLGGGALLFKRLPDAAECYEINSRLVDLYHIIKTRPDDLIAELQEVETTYNTLSPEDKKSYYIALRDTFNALSDIESNTFKRSVYFKIINKTCFNALYRENSKGKFNVPFGNGKNCKICDRENILNMSSYFNQKNINIHNKDFEVALANIVAGDFVYLDPPYYPLKESSFTAYTKAGFCKEDHIRLVELCKKIHNKGAYFMLSNSNCDFMKDAFVEECYTVEEISIARTLNSNKNKRGKSKCELIVYNY